MAVGKNKRLSRGGKKGAKKKAVECMLRKEWYDIVAPATFKVRQFGKTICNKTIGEKLANTNLMGRVYEANLADLKGDITNKELSAYKLKFQVQKVTGRNLLTQFHSLELTTDKLRSLFRKWCTTIESVIDAKTADGYTLKVFVICFTVKNKDQLSKNCYANQHMVKWLRARMTAMVQRKFAKLDINTAVRTMTDGSLAKKVEARVNPILPIRDLKIRRVKCIRTGDGKGLMDAHGKIPDTIEDQPRIVEEAVEAPKEEEKKE
jgi:small subunit ribosomal protein S3Ae